MICPNCGNETPDNDKTCKYCGYEFQDDDLSTLDFSESSISEQIPSKRKKNNIFSESAISEQVPYDEALNTKYGDVKNKKKSKNDVELNGEVWSSISEEIPNSETKENMYDETAITEQTPLPSDLDNESNDNKIQSAISEEISGNQQGKNGKKTNANVLLIIALLLVSCMLIYFGARYIQTGNSFYLGSTGTPQTTATQAAALASDYSANIVETEINGKIYYSLIVNGKKGSVITVNDKDTYNLDGISISIPINVSDYTQDQNAQEVTASIKVKIVTPENEEINIDVPPFTFKVQSTTETPEA